MGARRHLRFITTNPIQSFISCMFLLVLAGRESLISTCGGRAFPTASTVLRRSLFGSTLSKQSKFTDIQHRINSNIVFSNVVLASNSNEDNDTFGSNDLNGNSNDKDNRVPSTGWNHNPPSETSRFWQSPNGDSAAARQSKASSTTGSNGNSNNEPRTGWLHNTKPKEKDNDTAKVGGISKAQQRLKQAMKAQEENHRIVHPPSFHACGNDRQIVVTEHRISVPVFQDSKQPRIDVAFSIVEERGRELSHVASFGAPVFSKIARNQLQYSVESVDSFRKFVYDEVVEGKAKQNQDEVMTKAEARETLGLINNININNNTTTNGASDISKSEIKQAYRKLSFDLHPDRFQGTPEECEAAAHQFSKVKIAYETLSSDVRGLDGISWYESLGGRARTGFVGPINLLPLAAAQEHLSRHKAEGAICGLDPVLVQSFVARHLRSE
ncbi:DnaJ domain containing protein [Nitzschia inconspicua]|uniref:DnaJ domain containing protein n=1 Tax=Nitzschia inconspicua TaxID=303405 RepID=A0A9K3K9F8_9STRA|nr:DnaJ domain containing protein [Nitzschia inconspicua]